MDRRQFLGVVGSAGVVATAGCSMPGGSKTLTEPTVRTDASERRSLSFTANGEEVGSLGVTGTVTSDVIDLSTEIRHRRGTNVKSIELRVWMPPADAAAEVAVVSPVEGDSSPPPSVSLYSPEREPGTIVAIDDLDDLEDETISTLDLIVRPGSETATTLEIDATIGLTSGGLFSTDYTLDGRLQLEFPTLNSP